MGLLLTRESPDDADSELDDMVLSCLLDCVVLYELFHREREREREPLDRVVCCCCCCNSRPVQSVVVVFVMNVALDEREFDVSPPRTRNTLACQQTALFLLTPPLL